MLFCIPFAYGQRCRGWRQTGGCDPLGPRESAADLDCSTQVPRGSSGFCECDGGRKVSLVTCDHEALVCSIECDREEACSDGQCGDEGSSPGVGGGKCIGWRQTGGCDPLGPREPSSDLSCSDVVSRGASGYCECEGDRQVSFVGCDHPPFMCSVACRADRDRTCTAMGTCGEGGGEGGPVTGGGTAGAAPESRRRRARDASKPYPWEAAAAEAAPSEAAAVQARAVEAAPPEQGFGCVGWRQTSGCSAAGRREPGGDKACDAAVPPGASGYCECRGLKDGAAWRVRLSSCDHPPFTCADECARAAHYACVAWRQTAGCSADGDREPAADRTCAERVAESASGYCECGGGRRVPRPPGCGGGGGGGGGGASFRCEDECSRGEDLYEMLGLSEGATEAALKRAFRQMSLRLHPDKQRGAGRETAAARFQEVRYAYDLLSDPGRRALYDMHGMEAVDDGEPRQRGGDFTMELSVGLAELYTGSTKSLTIKRLVVCTPIGGSNPKTGRLARALLLSRSGLHVHVSGQARAAGTHSRATRRAAGGAARARTKCAPSTCSWRRALWCSSSRRSRLRSGARSAPPPSTPRSRPGCARATS